MDYVAGNCLRRHNNADIVSNTKLSFPEHISQSGICSYCSRCANCEIGFKAKTASPVFPAPFGSQFGAEKRLTNLQDLQIIPEIYGTAIDFRKVKTETEIGGFKVKAPLVVSSLENACAQNSCSTIVKGAALAGLPFVLEECALSANPKILKERFKEFSSNYKKFGAIIARASLSDLQSKLFEKAAEFGAMGLELKLGQGAGMGLGNQAIIADSKETKQFEKMGYFVMKENNALQRHSLPASISDNELRDKLIKLSELELPLWIRVSIGAGIIKLIESLQRIKREQGVQLNCLTIEGFGSGTSMAPWLIMNETGLPSAALFGVLDDKPSFDIVLSGGFADGADIAKALMLGAKGVSMSRAFLIAANAIKEGKKNGIENFASAIEKELQFFCATQRLESIEDLHRKKKNLFALSKEAAEMFGCSYNPKTVL
jgi:hypothetical protein